MVEYTLLFDDGVYEVMARSHYDAFLWMARQPVLTVAANIARSKKKLQELCKRGVIQVGDMMTMTKSNRNGDLFTFSATVESIDQSGIAGMRTIGAMNANLWTCKGPNDFDAEMARAYPTLETSFRHTWETVNVTRNAHGLGSLFLLRQCFQLWEDEMEKWGCNGLGEALGDR